MFLSFLFFFKQKTAYDMRISDWSSDVCSSDLTYTDVTEITRSREALEEKGREMTRYFEDIEMQRAMVEQQAQQMVHMAEDLALRNKEIEKSRAESDFQAKHDELTGLPNRR